MIKLQLSTRRLAMILGFVLAFPAVSEAQRLGVSVGFTRIPGRIGELDSNEGIALRAGFELNPKSVVRIGFEAGWDRLNEARRVFQSSCIHPAGGTATCYSDSRARDIGWSLAAMLRGGPNAGTVRPYGLVGLEVLSVRTHGRTMVTDSTGAHLTNFEFDGVTTDGALVLPLGAGLLFRPGGSSFGIGLEGRVSPVVFNYSGGLMLGWSPSLMLGVRWGG